MLWTGNGYHIYQPVDGILLEEYETFYEFSQHQEQQHQEQQQQNQVDRKWNTRKCSN